jgi:hypothetical protein
VVVDELGNTISAADYRREKAEFLALEVSRIAWASGNVSRARNIAAQARKYARG